MNAMLKDAQGVGGETFAIRELAERTGVAAATLRMWEQRHGFPAPERLASGHRRYTQADVEAVRQVVERRDAGTRLDVAIARVLADRRGSQAGSYVDPPTQSVFAELRREFPHLDVFKLSKTTLIALSWAIEDEFCAKADRAHVFGAFQRAEFFTRASKRWTALSRFSRTTVAFADFSPAELETDDGIVRVGLEPDSPLHREWAVVCDAAELPAALTAWEIPGQQGVHDHDRLFEAIWTVEPHAVRHAARVMAGFADLPPVLYDLADNPPRGTTDLSTVTTLFNRVVAYVDEAARREIARS